MNIPLEGLTTRPQGQPSRFFTWEELRCQYTKRYPNLTPAVAEFLGHLDQIREIYGPMKVTSGFRHYSHPVEAQKASPGTHALGLAVDVKTGSPAANFALVEAVFRVIDREGVRDQFGVGVHGQRFVHIDQGGDAANAHRPAFWTY